MRGCGVLAAGAQPAESAASCRSPAAAFRAPRRNSCC